MEVTLTPPDGEMCSGIETLTQSGSHKPSSAHSLVRLVDDAAQLQLGTAQTGLGWREARVAFDLFTKRMKRQLGTQ